MYQSPLLFLNYHVCVGEHLFKYARSVRVSISNSRIDNLPISVFRSGYVLFKKTKYVETER